MSHKAKSISEVIIKFQAPTELKEALQQLADERNIALSALLRLIASEYVKRHKIV
jgi:predicted transcriptional regulator